jgi:hypothetical protein
MASEDSLRAGAEPFRGLSDPPTIVNARIPLKVLGQSLPRNLLNGNVLKSLPVQSKLSVIGGEEKLPLRR